MRFSRPRQSDGLIKHGTVMLVATVITGLSNTLFYVLMIRMLTREDFGDYNGLISLHYILIIPFAAVQIVTARYVSAFESQHMLGQVASLLRRSIFKLSLAAAALMLGFLASGPLLKVYLNINSLSAIYAVGLAVSLALVASVLWGLFRVSNISIIMRQTRLSPLLQSSAWDVCWSGSVSECWGPPAR